MRVLVVDEEIPFPLNSGKRIRTYNLLKPLASRHEIIFACRCHEGIEQSNSYELEKLGIETKIIPHEIKKKGGLKFYIALMANIFSKYPYVVSSHYSRHMIGTIKNELKYKKLDLIHCEWVPYAINLKPFLPVPAVVVAHNIESVIWRRLFEFEKNPFKKAYIYLQWIKMHHFERNFYSYFDHTVTVSNQDKAIMEQWILNEKIAVVENGVDVNYFRPLNLPERPWSLVFTGSLDWRPNVDGVVYFLDEIWPLVLQSFPESHFTVVGRYPLKILENRVRQEDSVTLKATVDDVRPFIDESSVYVVPLRCGSGSRLKILEALSMGKAVVSSVVGAEGLEVVHGKDILIANKASDFATSISRLFLDQTLRKRLGFSGRSLVKRKYQWNILSEKLEKIWIKTVGMD